MILLIWTSGTRETRVNHPISESAPDSDAGSQPGKKSGEIRI